MAMFVNHYGGFTVPSAQLFYERTGSNVVHSRHHTRVGVHGLRDSGVSDKMAADART